MKQKFHTKKLCFILGVIALVAIGGWYMLYHFVDIAADSAVVLEAEYKDKSTQEDQDRAFKKFLEENGASAETLSGIIIKKGETVSFIESVESLARSSGLGITMNTVATIADEVNIDTHEYISLQFTLQGTWRNMYAFMSMLELLPRKVRITAVGVNQLTVNSPGEGGISSSAWRGEFTIEVLKQKEN